MTNDVGMVLFGIHPTIPHSLMDEVAVLGYAHGIDITASAVVLLTTSMGIGIAEDYFGTATVDTLSLTRTCEPVFIPTDHIFYG